jgi:membrane associated rhomboid family serine protease
MFPLRDNIPTDRLPIVTILLILANVFVYFFVQHGGILDGPRDKEVVEYGAIPYEVTHPGEQCGTTAMIAGGGRLETGGQVVCEGTEVTLSTGERATVAEVPEDQPSAWLTLLTSMFLHGGILHLAGNMLFLWIFGGNVEDAMARWRYLLFYLLGGLAAIGLQIAIDPSSTVPTVGASGAIAAVLGGYILLYPRARVVTIVFIVFLFTLIELPAWLMLGLWFLEQAVIGAGELANPTGGGGGVAYFAHIGGFAFGLLAIRAFAQRRKRLAQPRGWA